MSWSPDGRLIAFSGWDKKKRAGIFLITVETGEVKLLVPLETRVPNFDPTWAPDSKTIAYGYESNVYVVNIEDGKRPLTSIVILAILESRRSFVRSNRRKRTAEGQGTK